MDHKHLGLGDIPVFGSSETPFGYVNRAMSSGPAIAIGRKGTIDKPFMLWGDFWAVDTCMFNSVTNPAFQIGYCFYVASIVPWLDYSTKTALPSLTQTQVDNIPLPMPPVVEQREIVAQLDRATTRIDALVSKKARFIELLREKREAQITHAVTNGLDDGVPTKDSGVEWIGRVPAHWDIVRLKRDISFLTSGSRGWAEHYSDEGAIFLRIGNLNRGDFRLDLSDVQRVSPPAGAEGERTKVQPGDVLFSITAYLGSVGLIPSGIGEAFVSQHIALARLHKKIFHPEWVAYAAISGVGMTYVETQGYGGTKVQLGLDDISGMLMTAPPVHEQRAIADHLNCVTTRIDTLVAKTERSIELLREHRTALITAAVTGRINLRNAA
ncbi:MAG: restriction endonuclease subunit S [Gammaproteobacteria bacterium]